MVDAFVELADQFHEIALKYVDTVEELKEKARVE